MATRVIDPLKALELIKKYRPEVALKGSGGTIFYEFLCPFHSDTNPSMQYFPSSDSGQCRSCKARGSLVDIINKLEGSEIGKEKVAECQVTISRAAQVKKANAIDIPDEQIRLWHEALATDTNLQVLCKKWGWTDEVLTKYAIGSSENRMVFPVYEKDTLVNVKFYTPGAKDKKYENKAGSYVGVWPLANLDHKVVYVVEGEKDCMTMISQGFNAVTFTGGALTIPKAYLQYFMGKVVYIIYDIDEAGHKGSNQLAQALSRLASKVFVIDLPPGDLPAKGDITDLYMYDPENFKDKILCYAANTTEFIGRTAISRIVVPPEVHPTYLENVVKSKLFYKRVSMKVRVVNNAKDEVTLLPKEVIMSCSKDYKENVCATCPLLHEANGIPMIIKPEFPEILSIIGNNVKKLKEALRSLCEIAPGCPRFDVQFKSFQSIYPIVVIPSIEANKPSHDYSMVGAWAIDIPAKENDDYAAEAVVLSNPESQKMEIVCYKMVQDIESLDEYELSKEMIDKLRIFQVKETLCTDRPSQT